MANEELNAVLYQRMCDEFNDYESKLLEENPKEILQSAYGYLIRQDILYAMEDINLSNEECKVLLAQEHPLASIFSRWEDHESSYMDEIRNVIHVTSDELIKDRAKDSEIDSR